MVMLDLLRKVNVKILKRIIWDKHGIEFSIYKTFDELGLDALDMIEICIDIESELNISIESDLWDKFCESPMVDWIVILREDNINKIIE